jgi:hypothetical protein
MILPVKWMRERERESTCEGGKKIKERRRGKEGREKSIN